MPWEWMLPLALIPALMAGVFVAIASVSGWSRLLARYRAEREPFDGPRWTASFLRIGWCDYNGCVIYRVAPEGLYIAVWAIIVGHPPLLIPWSEIRVLEERPARWFARAICEVGQPTLAKLAVPLTVIQAATEWLNRQK